jgi:hypothetical protein
MLNSGVLKVLKKGTQNYLVTLVTLKIHVNTGTHTWSLSLMGSQIYKESAVEMYSERRGQILGRKEEKKVRVRRSG